MIDGWQQVIAGVIFISIVTIILVKLSKRSISHDLRARDVTKGHHWCYTGMFSQVRIIDCDITIVYKFIVELVLNR